MPRYNPLKQRATQMRDAGHSYNFINQKLGVTKSTLSNWFKNRPYSPNKGSLERIKYGPARAAELRHNQRVRETQLLKEVGRKDIGNLTKRDLFLLGLGIYIGEGSKSYEFTQIINSDPRIIALAIRWFHEICNAPLSNIMVRLYLYPDSDVRKCAHFWRRITGLPSQNFQSPTFDHRVNKSRMRAGKLPYGAARITIVSKGNPDLGVRLHRKVMGWIDGALPEM